MEKVEYSMSRRCSTLRYRIQFILMAMSLLLCPIVKAQSTPPVLPSDPEHAMSDKDPAAESELRAGIDLTGRGLFAQAIPHLAAAQGRVRDEYAADFNLALCHIGLGQFRPAIQILSILRSPGSTDSDVENLLAQAYVGDQQPDKAFEVLQKASTVTPRNERLYLFISDACADQQDYDLGLRVADLGLRHLPDSPRLHYQRAYFLSRSISSTAQKPTSNWS